MPRFFFSIIPSATILVGGSLSEVSERFNGMSVCLFFVGGSSHDIQVHLKRSGWMS